MPEGSSQELLDRAVPDPDPDSNSTKLYAVVRGWCFVAQPTDLSNGVYHGYPVPGCEMPERVLKALERAGSITRADRARLRKQPSVPESF